MWGYLLIAALGYYFLQPEPVKATTSDPAPAEPEQTEDEWKAEQYAQEQEWDMQNCWWKLDSAAGTVTWTCNDNSSHVNKATILPDGTFFITG